MCIPIFLNLVFVFGLYYNLCIDPDTAKFIPSAAMCSESATKHRLCVRLAEILDSNIRCPWNISSTRLFLKHINYWEVLPPLDGCCPTRWLWTPSFFIHLRLITNSYLALKDCPSYYQVGWPSFHEAAVSSSQKTWRQTCSLYFKYLSTRSGFVESAFKTSDNGSCWCKHCTKSWEWAWREPVDFCASNEV